MPLYEARCLVCLQQDMVIATFEQIKAKLIRCEAPGCPGRMEKREIASQLTVRRGRKKANMPHPELMDGDAEYEAFWGEPA